MALNKVIFITGVSGVGKSTIAALLSKKLSIPFFDGDDFHSEENISKMAGGIPLNDDDRKGWLQTLNKLAKKQVETNDCIIVCSALKEKYRSILSDGTALNTEWVFLSGDYDMIIERMKKRADHFMPAGLLKSQFDSLEIPTNAFCIDINLTPDMIVEKIKDNILIKAEFGLFGLGVMGKSLARNLASKGFKISMFNRHVNETEVDVALVFKQEHKELSASLAFDDVKAFVESIETPRKIMLMVNAGKTIDMVIEGLLPYLSEGDILIDGGNSHYEKTKERTGYLQTKNIHFIGVGVSGGEEGALKGPSIMPGGNMEAYQKIKPFLEAIAAKDKNNLPCCTYIGPDGSGHFVKMVHNGIEYVEMQLLAETVNILKSAGHNPDAVADILEGWKTTDDSYLLGITVEILRKKEGEDWLVNKILDKAGNKGTGNWTTIAATQLGMPSTLIATALFARYISFFKETRIQAQKDFRQQNHEVLNSSSDHLLKTYQFARIMNHYQGFELIEKASQQYQWNLKLNEIARIWTSGCIIKSNFMQNLVNDLQKNTPLLQNKSYIKRIKELKPAANLLVSQCILYELPIPCFTEAVTFHNSITTADSAANIIQAQRDYFGAHTYQRVDDASEKFYHTQWE